VRNTQPIGKEIIVTGKITETEKIIKLLIEGITNNKKVEL
jgi:hypothetical protein